MLYAILMHIVLQKLETERNLDDT